MTEKPIPLTAKSNLEDTQSTIIGFLQLCFIISHETSGWSIVPAMINSDSIENYFCQQSGKFNGLNTHPTALQYQRNASMYYSDNPHYLRKVTLGD
ncbi:hypothetical protein DPMN_023221 [Dreissena polymorpha]|uniref:Uncharacterized protein n=1 Tax=Dreissena polymorpha TaxID=45954 RepID=A0A9D4RAI7_DREPO|nr:hypothetical protein DPMN_023221 [Dreissena polymorpha]